MLTCSYILDLNFTFFYSTFTQMLSFYHFRFLAINVKLIFHLFSSTIIDLHNLPLKSPRLLGSQGFGHTRASNLSSDRRRALSFQSTRRWAQISPSKPFWPKFISRDSLWNHREDITKFHLFTGIHLGHRTTVGMETNDSGREGMSYQSTPLNTSSGRYVHTEPSPGNHLIAFARVASILMSR